MIKSFVHSLAYLYFAIFHWNKRFGDKDVIANFKAKTVIVFSFLIPLVPIYCKLLLRYQTEIPFSKIGTIATIFVLIVVYLITYKLIPLFYVFEADFENYSKTMKSKYNIMVIVFLVCQIGWFLFWLRYFASK